MLKNCLVYAEHELNHDAKRDLVEHIAFDILPNKLISRFYQTYRCNLFLHKLL